MREMVPFAGTEKIRDQTKHAFVGLVLRRRPPLESNIGAQYFYDYIKAGFGEGVLNLF